MRAGGFEPPWILIHSILSAVRLPFRHARNIYNTVFCVPAALRCRPSPPCPQYAKFYNKLFFFQPFYDRMFTDNKNVGDKNMRKASWVILAFLPFAAHAAGTYYTGAYQSPQTRYSTQAYAQRQTGYNRSYTTPSYASTRYNTYNTAATQNSTNNATQRTATSSAQSQSSKKSGFWLDAGITHEMAQWQFSMNQSGSILSYDNIAWNVLDISAGYAFDVGSTTLQVDAGFKYGMQWGENAMYDDDITNGGYLVTSWTGDVNDDQQADSGTFDQIGHAMSIGTSQGGNMMEFNVGFGLTDVFKVGNVSITPSVGYRYLKYKLETEKNYGLAVDTHACFEIDGEIQCDPALIFNFDNGKQAIIWRDDIMVPVKVPDGATSVDTAGTYYYQQPGVSHSYETTWAGPYIALDMDYEINQNNAVNGHIELGFPGYTSEGDQPYRFDWQHPKSVEDEAGMFSAFHFGLGANWTTAITDAVALSIGLTYDYYTVSDADAKTYLNESYYTDMYNAILNQEEAPWKGDESAMLDPETGSPTAINIKALEEQCPGWVCSTGGEVNSFYKALGIRVGINAKF